MKVFLSIKLAYKASIMSCRNPKKKRSSSSATWIRRPQILQFEFAVETLTIAKPGFLCLFLTSMAEDFTYEIREVWSYNLESEFLLIRSVIKDFPFVSMDTEFPGVVYREASGNSYTKTMSPVTNYYFLKQNVDALKIIQLGLTLADSEGNLPHFGNPNFGYLWEFNFMDFDVYKDSHAPESIELLRNTGIDFEKNRSQGINSFKFAELMMSSGLILNNSTVTWVTFHCGYDFGYLVKLLTQEPLPLELREFHFLLQTFFGDNVFDVKHIIKFCDGMYGGLNRVAAAVGVERLVGKSHQAGSDSFLTWQVFRKIRDHYFNKTGSLDKLILPLPVVFLLGIKIRRLRNGMRIGNWLWHILEYWMLNCVAFLFWSNNAPGHHPLAPMTSPYAGLVLVEAGPQYIGTPHKLDMFLGSADVNQSSSLGFHMKLKMFKISILFHGCISSKLYFHVYVSTFQIVFLCSQ